MPLKNDIKQAKVTVHENLKDIEEEIISFIDKIRFKVGIHLPFGWWFFGAGFTLCFIIFSVANLLG